MITAFVLALASAALPQTAAVQAASLTFSAPRLVAALDKIKGEPIQLAWSADGTELYVETGSRTRIGTFENQKHYLVTAADGKIKNVDAAPQWATDYQTWKANKWAPGARTFAKERSDAFTNAELDACLRQAGVKHLAVMGVFAPHCVRSTVQGALARKYRVTVVKDGVGAASDGARARALVKMAKDGGVVAEARRVVLR